MKEDERKGKKDVGIFLVFSDFLIYSYFSLYLLSGKFHRKFILDFSRLSLCAAHAVHLRSCRPAGDRNTCCMDHAWATHSSHLAEVKLASMKTPARPSTNLSSPLIKQCVFYFKGLMLSLRRSLGDALLNEQYIKSGAKCAHE